MNSRTKEKLELEVHNLRLEYDEEDSSPLGVAIYAMIKEDLEQLKGISNGY